MTTSVRSRSSGRLGSHAGDPERLPGIAGGDDRIAFLPQDAGGKGHHLGLVIDYQDVFHGLRS